MSIVSLPGGCTPSPLSDITHQYYVNLIRCFVVDVNEKAFPDDDRFRSPSSLPSSGLFWVTFLITFLVAFSEPTNRGGLFEMAKSPHKWYQFGLPLWLLHCKKKSLLYWEAIVNIIKYQRISSACSSWPAWVRVALDCLTVSFCCRGRWSLTTARSHLPDSPPEFTAWDCSPLLPFATYAGLDRI